jgi:hypothetical protein
MRPELARTGLFNIMMEKSLIKIGRDRHVKQCKKSVYMGGLGEEFVDLETSLQANRIRAGEQKVQREGLMQR